MTNTSKEPLLPYGERYAWGYMTTAVAVPVVYVIVMLGRLRETPADQVDFQVPLFIAVGASIVLNMFLAPPPRKGRDRRDERDKAIIASGERAGFGALGIGVLLPFGLVLAEVDYVWIAGAIYLAYCASAVATSIATIVGYRRGF